MKGTLILAIALLATVVSTSVYAADDGWVSAVETDSTEVYIRTSDIKANLTYSYVEVWEKYITKKDSTYVMAKSRYYCLSEKAQTLESHAYSNSGKHLNSDRKASTAEYVIPDSVREGLLEGACLAGAVTELLEAHYADGGDISVESYRKIVRAFGSYSTPAMLHYNKNKHELD